MLETIADLVSLQGARWLGAPRRRSDGPPRPFSLEDLGARARVLATLSEHGALGGHFHWLSRDPWQFVSSRDGRALIGFQERAFSLVAWRDPVGPATSRSDALVAFRAHARKLGKHAIVLGAGDELARDADMRGFGTHWIGAEPFFDLASWHTRGKQGEKLRLAMNHARRAGGRARELDPLRDERDRAEIARVERAWKGARPERDNPSFMRTEPLENAEHRRYFGVETGADGERRLESFLVCSPVSRRGYYLQDLVRHPSAPRGATELVTVHAMHELGREGAEFATMGVVALLDPTNERATSPAVRWILARFDRLYRFSGLKQYREKFAPTRLEGVHVLHWPRALTPLAVWDISAVLSGPPRR